VAGTADGEHGSRALVAGAPALVPPVGPGSRAGPPGHLGQAFVFGEDHPPGDVGVQDHVPMFCATPVRQQ